MVLVINRKIKIPPFYERLEDFSSQAVTDFNNVWLEANKKNCI